MFEANGKIGTFYLQSKVRPRPGGLGPRDLRNAHGKSRRAACRCRATEQTVCLCCRCTGRGKDLTRSCRSRLTGRGVRRAARRGRQGRGQLAAVHRGRRGRATISSNDSRDDRSGGSKEQLRRRSGSSGPGLHHGKVDAATWPRNDRTRGSPAGRRCNPGRAPRASLVVADGQRSRQWRFPPAVVDDFFLFSWGAYAMRQLTDGRTGYSSPLQ